MNTRTRVPQIDEKRKARALTIVANDDVRPAEKKPRCFFVRSQKTVADKRYFVSLDRMQCECADAEWNDVVCKHLLAAQIFTLADTTVRVLCQQHDLDPQQLAQRIVEDLRNRTRGRRWQQKLSALLHAANRLAQPGVSLEDEIVKIVTHKRQWVASEKVRLSQAGAYLGEEQCQIFLWTGDGRTRKVGQLDPLNGWVLWPQEPAILERSY